MLPNRKEIASGRWRAILTGLGIEGKFLASRHGPCPICGGTDRYRYSDFKGHGDWICNQCGNGDGYALLQRVNGWTFAEAARQVEHFLGVAHPKAEPVADVVDLEARNLSRARATWAECIPVEPGDPVWRYLERRNVLPKRIPNCIRHHPALFYKGETEDFYPAMVAAVTDASGKGVTLHRTYLTEQGAKAPVDAPKKLMPGRMGEVASVKLARPGEVLGVAEGIETALAAMKRFRVPAWSCLNATLLERWTPPGGVTKVHIYADNDRSFTGQSAAYSLANRLRREGLAVEVHTPDEPDTDWADHATQA